MTPPMSPWPLGARWTTASSSTQRARVRRMPTATRSTASRSGSPPPVAEAASAASIPSALVGATPPGARERSLPTRHDGRGRRRRVGPAGAVNAFPAGRIRLARSGGATVRAAASPVLVRLRGRLEAIPAECSGTVSLGLSYRSKALATAVAAYATTAPTRPRSVSTRTCCPRPSGAGAPARCSPSSAASTATSSWRPARPRRKGRASSPSPRQCWDGR